MPGTISVGTENNFFKIVTTSQTSYPVECDAFFNFKFQKGLSLFLSSGTSCFISFTGSRDHLQLLSGKAFVQYESRTVSGVWVRTTSGAVTVHVEAWG